MSPPHLKPSSGWPKSLGWPSLSLHVYFNQKNGQCGIHLDPGSHRIGFAGQSDSEDIESHMLCSSTVIAGISQSSSEVPVSVLPLGRIPSSNRDPYFPRGFLTPARGLCHRLLQVKKSLLCLTPVLSLDKIPVL